MKKLVLLIMIGAFLAAGGTALALDNEQHVIQAPNSEGDLMFFPVGVALQGWDTKITVTNTSRNRSAVAKVIVRSAGFSKELLDFLIYLSPTDVWTGTLRHHITLGPVMFSDDDSCLSGPGVWANTVGSPMNQPLMDACDNDTNEIVYVTVIEAWSSDDYEDEHGTDIPMCDLDVPPVSKDCIYDAYHDHFSDTNDRPFNILTGHYELSILGALTVGDRAEVLRDYDNNDRLLATTVDEIGTGADNNLCEIEAALSKNHLAMPYYNDPTKLALHWVTFVTKLTRVDADCDCISNKGPFVGWEDCDDVVFSPLYFDLMENSPGCEDTVFSPYEPPPDRVFPWEVNFLFTLPDFIDANYKEGWIDYDFDYVTTCDPAEDTAEIPLVISYTGAPAIASSWLLNENGLCLIPSAHVDGTVKYSTDDEATWNEIMYYQYSNSDNSEY